MNMIKLLKKAGLTEAEAILNIRHADVCPSDWALQNLCDNDTEFLYDHCVELDGFTLLNTWQFKAVKLAGLDLKHVPLIDPMTDDQFACEFGEQVDKAKKHTPKIDGLWFGNYVFFLPLLQKHSGKIDKSFNTYDWCELGESLGTAEDVMIENFGIVLMMSAGYSLDDACNNRHNAHYTINEFDADAFADFIRMATGLRFYYQDLYQRFFKHVQNDFTCVGDWTMIGVHE